MRINGVSEYNDSGIKDMKYMNIVNILGLHGTSNLALSARHWRASSISLHLRSLNLIFCKTVMSAIL